MNAKNSVMRLQNRTRSIPLYACTPTGKVVGNCIREPTNPPAEQRRRHQGLITLLGSLSNAELASMMPRTGGQYVFLQRAYGPFIAFLYGWALFAVIQSGSIAALSYVFAEYTTRLIALPEASEGLAAFAFHLPLIGDVAPFKELGVKALASAVIVILTIVNYLGV